MSEELKPCPFCGGKANDTGTGFAACRRHGWDAVILPQDEWQNRPVEDAQTQRIAFLEAVLRAVDGRLGDACWKEGGEEWVDLCYAMAPHDYSQVRRVIAAVLTQTH